MEMKCDKRFLCAERVCQTNSAKRFVFQDQKDDVCVWKEILGQNNLCASPLSYQRAIKILKH